MPPIFDIPAHVFGKPGYTKPISTIVERKATINAQIRFLVFNSNRFDSAHHHLRKLNVDPDLTCY